MASSVFFKFKSQKEPTRVAFDGTGISVFELKREIILRSGLGDGTDFDLVICADEGMKEVYDDDTTIIPRSTTVIARRMPPKIQGRGGAARYVSGKMPAHAKNSSRKEHMAKPVAKPQSTTMAQLSSAMTEEEKMAAVFQAQTELFSSREEEMATQQYVGKGGPKRPANVPDHDPPQGYICYRCGEKGHWIQLCPTNDNPEYDNRPRVKRTTGIPKSFLKTVDKATALGQNADGDDSKTPSGIMVNADGEFVIAEPDKAAWEQFQAKAKSNAAAQKAASDGDKEVQERGLECPIDKKMFIDPMKTPCCEKTYCNDCITNALIESDFVCPGCKTEGVLIDDLKADDEAVEKMKAYLAEKDSKTKTGSKSPSPPKSPTAANGDATDTKTEAAKAKSKSPTPLTVAVAIAQPAQTTQALASATSQRSTAGTPTNGEQQMQLAKKRPAEDTAENPKIPKAPKAMQKAHETQQQQAMMEQMMSGMNGMNGMNGMAGMGGIPGMNGMNGVGGMNPMGGMPMMFPGMPMMGNYGGMGMPNMNMPNMNMGMVNPMMNPMMAGGMSGFPAMNNMNGGYGGMPNGNGMWGGSDMGMAMNQGAAGNGVGPNGMNGMNGMNGIGRMNNGGQAGFQQQPHIGQQNHQQQPQQHHNQQMQLQQQQQQQQHQQQIMHKNFSHQPADDDDAYFRKPVNPHRHQNRQRRVRPSDYREL
ncbi:DWNN domain-containing protein [Lasiosphaeria miniovina]|uniref:DWNN domain-containing protein n=1 Tax=Lasiosphaeria miniovina TaxID=1954250 RepID=A0AA40B403_9PEZI|nr:DWNN domain-containing protein [Lasiosphaeria miniovina]KAK0727185.1 DWNN domain-containing protein [Lasiosphaeria miniovina]